MNNQANTEIRHFLPSFASKILHWSLPDSLREPVIGDCEEGFADKFTKNKFKANIRLIKQLISVLWNFGLHTQRGSFMFILSMTFLIGIMVTAFYLSGSFSMFFNIPSVVIVIVPSIMAGVLSAEKGSFVSHFSILFDNTALSALKNKKDFVKTFDVMSQTAMLMAWFGIVTGLVAMSTNITKDTFADVFLPAFAVCILTLLYGIMIKTFCYFAKLRVLAADNNEVLDSSSVEVG